MPHRLGLVSYTIHSSLLHQQLLLVLYFRTTENPHADRPLSSRRSNSLGFWNRHSNLDSRPSLNLIEPRLETRELVKILEPGEVVASDPTTPR